MFPIVGFGASLGAVLGAVIAGWMIGPLGLDQLMLMGAVILVAQVMLTNYLDGRGRGGAETVGADDSTSDGGTSTTGESGSSKGAFGMVFGTPYLLMIGLMLMCLNWVNTTGEYILGSVVEDAARAAVAAGDAGGLSVEEYIGQFYSRFFSVVNVLGWSFSCFSSLGSSSMLGCGSP